MSALFPGGEGIFETIKTRDGIPFALSRHIARASRSAQRLDLSIPSESDIRALVAEVLATSPVTTQIGRLRVSFFTSGEVSVLHENYQRWINPARLTILDQPIDENVGLVGIKALPYTENIDCLDRAHSAGFDDGIRLNKKGQVCESAVANLLLRINGQWCTPNLASGCLPGITRELAIEWPGIQERVVEAHDLDRSDAIFLLSSLKDAQPVSSLNGRLLEIDSDLMAQMADRMAQDIDP